MRQHGAVFRSLNGALIHTVAFGAGPRTIVAHGGWTGSWELWEEPFELLSGTWRCIGYDHRGSGQTRVPPDSIMMDTLVADLWAVLDAHDVKRCLLAAESMGCLVALQAAAQRPERFDGLVLIAPPWTAALAASGALAAGARSDYAATVDWFTEACVVEPDSAHVLRWGRDVLLRSDAESAARLAEAGADGRVDPARITLPTLIIRGAADRIVPASDAQDLAVLLPDATLRILPGVGHVPTMTAAREVVRLMVEHFGVDVPSRDSDR